MFGREKPGKDNILRNYEFETTAVQNPSLA